MAHHLFPRIRVITAMTACLLLAAACGGGGSASVSGVGSGGTGSVSGVVTKGPVANASVSAYGIANGQMGPRIGTAISDAGGNFSMDIGSYAGPLMLQAVGGSYRDEATGTTMAMAPGDVMTALMPSVAVASNNAGIQVTPVTAMAQTMAQAMPGGMTEANIAAANAAMGAYFAVGDVLRIQPMNPLVPGSGVGASPAARNYGMTLAAMSQFAKTLNMPASSAMVTAMMNDASDGMMDGRQGANPIAMNMGMGMGMGGMMGTSMMSPTAGTTSMATAMTAFMNSANNVSGLTPTDMAGLMQKLSTATGRL